MFPNNVPVDAPVNVGPAMYHYAMNNNDFVPDGLGDEDDAPDEVFNRNPLI
jgi:hypothetical protein